MLRLPRVRAPRAAALIVLSATLAAACHDAAVAPPKQLALMTTTMVGRVGEMGSPAPTARLTDSYDNPLAGTAVTLTIVGGGTAAPTVTTDSAGVITIANWTLGTVAQQNALTLNA